MKRILALSIGCLVVISSIALLIPTEVYSQLGIVRVVASCSAAKFVTGGQGFLTIDVTGNLCSGIGTIADGADVAQGDTNDDRCTTTDTTACTLIGLNKQTNYLLGTPTGPTSAANANSQVIAYNTLASGITSAITDTTSTQVIAGTASNYIYISRCTVSNTDANTSSEINLQDGSGGTTIDVIPAPYGVTNSLSGATINYPIPLKVPTSGNGLYAAPITTGTSTKVACNGFKSTVSY